MVITGLRREALQAAVVLLTAARAGLDVSQDEIVASIPPSEVTTAVVTMAAGVLAALPGDTADQVLAGIGLWAAGLSAGQATGDR